MPNFGIWELVVLGVIIVPPVAIGLFLSSKALPNVIREIRLLWASTEPHSNHKDHS